MTSPASSPLTAAARCLVRRDDLEHILRAVAQRLAVSDFDRYSRLCAALHQATDTSTSRRGSSPATVAGPRRYPRGPAPVATFEPRASGALRRAPWTNAPADVAEGPEELQPSLAPPARAEAFDGSPQESPADTRAEAFDASPQGVVRSPPESEAPPDGIRGPAERGWPEVGAGRYSGAKQDVLWMLEHGYRRQGEMGAFARRSSAGMGACLRKLARQGTVEKHPEGGWRLIRAKSGPGAPPPDAEVD